MATRGLVIEDFTSLDVAYAAADRLVQDMHGKCPEMEGKHPTILYTDQPQLDQFWFAEFTGIWGI